MCEEKNKGYGIAYDLGTTTLVGYLCSLKDRRVICTISRPNPQTEYGMDVLSRISYANEDDENRIQMINSLGDAVAIMTEELLKSICQPAGYVCQPAGYACQPAGYAGQPAGHPICQRMVLVGNPVIMGFMDKYIHSCKKLSNLAKELVLLPPIGGYVGADALIASYEVELVRDKKNALLIDIGTNTEIVLLTNDVKLATSAAAGPALEGGNISCGMTGVDGAIDLVSVTEIVNGFSHEKDIVCHVIGDKPAKGICGSGILDLIRCLLDTGAIDNTGYLFSKNEALSHGVPNKIAARIFEPEDMPENDNNIRFFRLTDTISISSEDIRAVQLAKSAIRSGIEMLILDKSLTDTVIDELYLAGAFGNKISTDSLFDLGFVPEQISNGQCEIVQSGNLAGFGACHLTMEPEIITDVINLKNDTLTVSLADSDEFQGMFYKYMDF